MTKAQYYRKHPTKAFLRQMDKAKKRKAAIERQAAAIRIKSGISRSVINSRPPAAALITQHAASSLDTERSPAVVTRQQGMVSPGYPPVGSSTNSLLTSHSDCSANAAPVNGETPSHPDLGSGNDSLVRGKSRQAI